MKGKPGRIWRRTAQLVATIATAWLVFPAAAYADIVVGRVDCTFGTTGGAPAGGFYEFTVTGLQEGTAYAYVAVTPTGQIFAGHFVSTSGANRYTAAYYGPLTLIVLPMLSVTLDGANNVTSYDPAAALFSTTIIVPPCAEQRLSALTGLVAALNVNVGIENSLDAKLANVLDALAAAKSNSVGVACNKLDAFINEVQAQSGNQIDAADAATLIGLANDVRARLGCG